MAKAYDPLSAVPKVIQESVGRMTDEGLVEIPGGYIKIELSTQGLLGAPKLFHVRNFDTTDLINLALADEQDLPEKVANMVDNLIYEEDVSVLNFHEKEVVELLVRIYQAFYSDNLKDIDYDWNNEEDLLYLQKKLGGIDSDEYRKNLQDLKQKRWVPKTTITISKADLHDMDENIRPEIYIKTKEGFEVGFSFPRYGDIVLLKNFIQKEWREKDKQFASIKDTLKFRMDAEERVRQGEDIALNRIPNIPEAEKDKYKEYENEKSVFGVQAIKALHLIYIEGQDLRNLPLKERLILASSPKLDYTLMKKVSDHFTKMKIGFHDTIEMENPIKGVVEQRKYSFRLVDILQAIKLFEPDDYTISFEPSHSE